MRFDDRLLTVLNQPAGDRHDLAVRWRQLVDLVARAGSNAASPAVARALDTIRAEAPSIDERLRAAAARAVSALPLPLGLLEYFASDSLAVSAPVLAAATLDRAQWKAILGSAEPETRRFVEALHPQIGEEHQETGTDAPLNLTEPLVEEALEQPLQDLTRALIGGGVEERPESLIAPSASAPVPAGPASDETTSPGELAQEAEQVPEVEQRTAKPASPSLKELIERIERRRRSRSTVQPSTPGAAPTSETPALFRWECGPGGEIAWVDGAPRGALIGRSIARQQSGDDRVDPAVVRAFTRRAPFRDGVLMVSDGIMAGEWKISGVPVFEHTDGRFAGYRGIAVKEQPQSKAGGDEMELLADPDSLRELVHEIKTPLNAIIGFAEMIHGQYLGPAERRYRDRAQEIVRQARMLLTAIDELDFAAEARSSSSTSKGVNLNELVDGMMSALRELGAGRGVEIEAPPHVEQALASTQPGLVERLVFRLCTAVLEEAQAGERLQLSIEPVHGRLRVSITRPRRLSGGGVNEQLGDAPVELEEAFPLRLVRGLARIAGSELVISPSTISLSFPALSLGSAAPGGYSA